jgi:hypothetical protein
MTAMGRVWLAGFVSRRWVWWLGGRVNTYPQSQVSAVGGDSSLQRGQINHPEA